MLNPSLKKITLSKHELQKYSRHIILDKVGLNGQKRIKNGKVLFVGAGGLAASSILYLVTSGIGVIGIIDADKVSISNLHRQILYTNNDINELKVNVIKKKIHDTRSDCEVVTYPYNLTNQNALSIIKHYDIIIDTCDNFQTRYIIDKTCYILHKVHVYGAIAKFQGQVSVFNYKGGTKYSDIYPENLKLKNYSCNLDGVMGFLTGIIGILQANEAIKIILGIKEILSDNILIFNSLTTSFNRIPIKTKKTELKLDLNCKLKNIATINETQLEIILNANNFLLIDVRQNIEFKKNYILKSINIPLKHLRNKNTYKFLHNYCLDKTLIIYCNNNSRSNIACKILKQYQIQHLLINKGLDVLVKIIKNMT